jgi:hypothetical protein
MTNNQFRILIGWASLHATMPQLLPERDQIRWMATGLAATITQVQNLADHTRAELADLLGRRVAMCNGTTFTELTLAAGEGTWSDVAVDSMVECVLRPYRKIIRGMLIVLGLLLFEIAAAAIYLAWRTRH